MINPWLCTKCGALTELKKVHNCTKIYKKCPNCGLYPWRETVLSSKEIMQMVRTHKWLRVNELASILERSPSMVRYWVIRNIIPHYKIGGRTMFMEEDVPAIKKFVRLQGRRGPTKNG